MKNKILIVFLFGFSFAYSQTDTEFWFAAPELVAVGAARVQDMKFGFATYDYETTVQIIQPANSSFDTVTLVIPAGSYADYSVHSLRNVCVESKPSNKPLNYGFLIQSNFPITAYYQIKGDDSEIYTLKGRNALGTYFIVPMQYTLSGKGESDGARHSIEIVAADDNTEVTAIVSQSCEKGGGNAAIAMGDTVRYQLDRGQSVSLRSIRLGAGHQLRNTVIYTNNGKRIAVNSTDDMVAQGSSADLVGDQIVPVSLTGNTYIAYSGGETIEYVCLFPTTANNTKIYANGNHITTLNTTGTSGGVREFTCNMPKGATVFTSDGDNFIAFQVTGINSGGQELGGTMLPNLLCTGSNEVVYKPLFGTPRALLLVKDVDKGNFAVNGGTPGQFISASQFVSVDNGWSYYYGSLPAWGGAIRINNATGIFHFAVLDAQGGTCSYGYFSNYNKIAVEGTASASYFIEGDPVQLFLEKYAGLINIEWTLPDGSKYADDTLNISNTNIGQSGVYAISADNIDGCEIIPDTMFITVFPRDIQKNDTINVCYGNDVTITAEGYPPYLWSDSSSDRSLTITVNASSTVSVINSKAGTNMGVMLPDTLCGEKVKQLFEYMIPTEIIQNESYVFSADVEYSGGTGVPHIYFTVNGQIFGGQLGNLQPNVYSFNEKIWTSNSTHAKIGVFCDDSDRDICVKNLNFSRLFPFEDRYHINVLDSLKPNIQGDLAICNGAAVLSTDQNYETYLWSNGATTKSITINEAGDYWVRVTNGDCKGSGSVTILPQPEIDVEIDGTVEICLDAMIHVTIPYVEKEGEVGTYSIYFENRDYFQYIENRIPNNNAVEFSVGNEVKAGIYGAELKFVEKNCGTVAVYPLEIIIKYPSEIITQRWNDVLGVKNHNFNGGYDFVAYQWYKNGLALEGAVKSYFYEENGFAQNPPDRYSVLLTNENNEQIFTCDFEPEYIANANLQISLVRSQQIVGAPDNGMLRIWNITGTLYSTQQIENNQFVTPAKEGIYIVEVDGKRWKIIVQH